jgi:hypothetical protein
MGHFLENRRKWKFVQQFKLFLVDLYTSIYSKCHLSANLAAFILAKYVFNCVLKIPMYFRYQNTHIAPTELEELLGSHPAVQVRK